MKELTIVPLDNSNNLFYVENLYPDDLLVELLGEDFMNYEYTAQEWQESKPRRRLTYTQANDNMHLLSRMRNYLNSADKRKEIETKLGMQEISQIDSSYWLDMPGFNMGTHLDNSAVGVAMQICLGVNQRNLGTCFYHYSADTDVKDFPVRKQFEYRLNTGYIMINDATQWHGCPNTVPDNTFRLTSYSYLYGTR